MFGAPACLRRARDRPRSVARDPIVISCDGSEAVAGRRGDEKGSDESCVWGGHIEEDHPR